MTSYLESRQHHRFNVQNTRTVILWSIEFERFRFLIPFLLLQVEKQQAKFPRTFHHHFLRQRFHRDLPYTTDIIHIFTHHHDGLSLLPDRFLACGFGQCLVLPVSSETSQYYGSNETRSDSNADANSNGSLQGELHVVRSEATVASSTVHAIAGYLIFLTT
jgi:hypothetical protein